MSSVPLAATPTLTPSPRRWRQLAGAQILGSQVGARAMRASGRGGLLLFMSSIDSLYAAPGGEGVYAACKGRSTA
jgi:hypothetical protein